MRWWPNALPQKARKTLLAPMPFARSWARRELFWRTPPKARAGGGRGNDGTLALVCIGGTENPGAGEKAVLYQLSRLLLFCGLGHIRLGGKLERCIAV